MHRLGTKMQRPAKSRSYLLKSAVSFWKMKLLIYLSVLVLFGSFAPALRAQYEQAAITGTVVDPQGRPIPQARVEVKQAETGLSRTTVSTSAGVFFLNGLPLGAYAFVATHDGFSPGAGERYPACYRAD